jgi:Ribbon-helix-helix protein, copG family
MPPKPTYARIAITIPEQDLAAADELARDRDRSRSWIISEAVRQYVAQPAPVAHRPGLGALRHAQLVADLRLTPEERVRAAESTARAVPSRRSQADTKRVARVIGFDRYEDYLAWKRLGDIGA